jgi:glycosyltransferase involved in cell wall biosynthesis
VPPPELSVVLATLNRGRFIGETLESLLSQAPQEVDVVVVDGASSDQTPEVIERLRSRYPRLTYHRLPVNSGFDRDYDRAVELATGEFCWLMSDDDVAAPGAVARVLEAVRSGYEAVIVNAEVRTRDLASVIDARRLPFPDDRVYAPGDYAQLFVDTADYLTFLGGVVLRRSTWLKRERAPYFGSWFVHVGVLFQRPLEGRALVIADPLIRIRYGNAMWTPRSFEIWMFRWPELIWSLESMPDAARARVTPREPWRRTWNLLAYRATGRYGPEEYRHWLAPRLRRRRERLVARAIAALPASLVNLAGWAFLSLTPRASRLTLHDVCESPLHPFRSRAPKRA